jgi:hypothetical protein
MARKRTRKRTHAKRRNPARRHVTRRKTRMHNPRRRRHAKRRNPSVSHGAGGAAMAKSVAGGLIGVTLTRMVGGMLANFMPSLTGSPIMKAVISGVSAFGVGKIVGGIDKDFGAAAAFGGYMVAGSDALNAFVPSLGAQVGLKGLGAFMPSRFAVPENPVMRGQMIAAAAPPAGVNGAFVRRTF